MRVGFIGVGTMGGPMAANLIRAGHALTVYDVVPAAMEALVGQGARTAGSPREAAAAGETVISMLPASRHVVAAMFGPDGAIEGLRPGATLIDMSTIDPGTTRRVAEAVGAKGARMLDAPVSGSSTGATAGTLTIMVGGDLATLNGQRDLLGAMGTNVIHCGPIGMGETVKLANNLVSGVTMAAVAEAFALGVKAGADPRILFEVLSKSSANCWSLQTRPPVPGLVPTSELTLTWASFSAAAAQAGISRRYGGIHFEQADLDARATGRAAARRCWTTAHTYFDGTAPSSVQSRRHSAVGDSTRQGKGRTS